jgi:hypothetical protein
VTRYAQLAKYRDLREQLIKWEQSIPGFLDWTKAANAPPGHAWVNRQRAYLETQSHCINMKVSWSIAHLDPLLMAKFQPHWNIGNTYSDAIKAGRRILEIVEQCAISSNSSQSYHSDALRATMTLLQILLRNDLNEAKIDTHELVTSCRDAIKLCRKLVPAFLTKIEDTIEKLLDQYSFPSYTLLILSRQIERIKSNPPILNDRPGPATPKTPAAAFNPEALFPYDNTQMEFLLQVENFQGEVQLYADGPAFPQPEAHFEGYDMYAPKICLKRLMEGSTSLTPITDRADWTGLRDWYYKTIWPVRTLLEDKMLSLVFRMNCSGCGLEAIGRQYILTVIKAITKSKSGA